MERFLCPRLREDQKKKKKKGLQPELGRFFFCPKSLLFVLLLQFYDQQPYVCATTCMCSVSEICVRAHSLGGTLVSINQTILIKIFASTTNCSSKVSIINQT